jgi:predicted nucleic acid-binding Zn ribbon protein
MKKPDRKCQVCGFAISRGNVNRFCSRKCAALSRRIDPLVRIKRNAAIDQRGCWVWQRRKFPNGYACIRANGRNQVASRIMFELQYGPIPSGRQLHHKCENKACCNQGHLELVSPSEHVKRSPKFLGFINRHKTHCAHGMNSRSIIPTSTSVEVDAAGNVTLSDNLLTVARRENSAPVQLN